MKDLCSNQRTAKVHRDTKEFEVEFLRRTTGDVAFVSSAAGRHVSKLAKKKIYILQIYSKTQ